MDKLFRIIGFLYIIGSAIAEAFGADISQCIFMALLGLCLFELSRD